MNVETKTTLNITNWAINMNHIDFFDSKFHTNIVRWQRLFGRSLHKFTQNNVSNHFFFVSFKVKIHKPFNISVYFRLFICHHCPMYISHYFLFFLWRSDFVVHHLILLLSIKWLKSFGDDDVVIDTRCTVSTS